MRGADRQRILSAGDDAGPRTQEALFKLDYEYGFLKIALLTVVTLLFSYYFDLYEPSRISEGWEVYFRLLLVLGVLSFLLSGVLYFFPEADIAHSVLLLGLGLLTAALIAWRSVFEWVVGRGAFREKVFVLGDGERANTVVEMLRNRTDAGMEVVGWKPITGVSATEKDTFAAALEDLRGPKPKVARIIVAMQDRRGLLPVRELLKMRFDGVIIEDASDLLERLSGKLLLDGLRPRTSSTARVFAFGPRNRSPGVSSLPSRPQLVCFCFCPFSQS